MFWGTITYEETGIVAFVDGNMNSQKYISILDKYLWPAQRNILETRLGISGTTTVLYIAPERRRAGCRDTISHHFFLAPKFPE